MVDAIWAWMSNAQNQTTLNWLGSGVVAVVVAAWALYLHFKKSPDAPAQQLKAGAGATNVIAGDSATVIIQRDPEVGRVLNMLEQQQKERAASDDFYRQQIQSTQQKYEEQARELRDLRARAIEFVVQQAALPNPAPEATAAKRGLEAGNTQLSEVLLRESERTAAAQGHDSLRRAAELARQQGALALLHEGTHAALDAYRRATEYEPENVLSWDELGNLLVQAGNLSEAACAYQQMLTLSTAKTTQDPTNTQWQRDLSVSHNKIGDVLVKNGKLDEALVAYGKGFAIRKTLAAKDASNTDWQRDLSVSHDRIGNVLVKNDKLVEALAAYGKGLAIRKTLAAKDASNTQWQRDLSFSHDNIGDVLAANGKPDEALAAYHKGLTIAETLAAQDASNTEWQRDLSISHNKTGDMLVKNGKLDEALVAYGKGLAIRETLAAKDASNTEWQRDLAVSYAKLGTHASLPVGERQNFLRRGLDILQKQKTLGQLPPINQAWIEEFEKQLQEISVSPMPVS